MFTLKIENTIGQIVELTHNEGQYQIIEVQGLAPPNALILTSNVAGMDGNKVTSKKLEPRNVVILLQINGDVENNRINLFKYLGTKQWCKIYYQNGRRNVYAEGHVETNEVAYFQNGQTMQISIVCPDPYWLALNDIVTDISQVLGLFEFPFAFGAAGVEEVTITDDAWEFSIYLKDRITNVPNEGEDDTGVVIEITATGTVVNPAIYNVDTRDSMGLKMTLQKNDVITIDTNRGAKSITLLRDAIISNEINKLVQGSTWFTLAMGDNQFTYDAETGAEDMTIRFKSRTRYKGV